MGNTEVAHAHLFVVDKDGCLELLRNPFEQVTAVLRLDIDQNALGEEYGGQGVIYFCLLQLAVHLVEVAQVNAHQVVAGSMQIRGTEPHLTILVVNPGQQSLVALNCVALAGGDRGEVQLNEVLHLVGGVPQPEVECVEAAAQIDDLAVARGFLYGRTMGGRRLEQGQTGMVMRGVEGMTGTALVLQCNRMTLARARQMGAAADELTFRNFSTHISTPLTRAK